MKQIIFISFFNLIFQISSSCQCTYTTTTFASKTYFSDLVIKCIMQAKETTSKNSNKTITVLEILKVYKGNNRAKQIKVKGDLSRISSLPTKYFIGDTAIVFLNKESKPNLYSIYGSSECVKTFTTNQSFLSTEARLIELVKIQSRPFSRKKIKSMKKWALRCFHNKETRYIAAEEFSKKGFYYYRHEKKQKYLPRRNAKLNRREKKYIRTKLHEIKDYYYFDEIFINLIAKKKDKDLTKIVLQSLENYHQKYIYHEELTSMKWIVSNSEIKSIWNEIEKELEPFYKIEPSNNLLLKFIAATKKYCN